MTDDADEDDLRLYCDFKITAFDRDGNVVQEQVINETGSFTMEDISSNALVNGGGG
jgi:hypothetical protein